MLRMGALAGWAPIVVRGATAGSLAGLDDFGRTHAVEAVLDGGHLGPVFAEAHEAVAGVLRGEHGAGQQPHAKHEAHDGPADGAPDEIAHRHHGRRQQLRGVSRRQRDATREKKEEREEEKKKGTRLTEPWARSERRAWRSDTSGPGVAWMTGKEGGVVLQDANKGRREA